MVLRRLIAALASAGAAFLFGLALGERGELGAVQYVFLGVIPIAIAVIARFAKRARAEVLWIGTALVLGLIVGQDSFRRAYDDCVARGHLVRDAIDAWYEKNGDYPPRLDALAVPDMPCRCLLRRSILHYFQNERGYRLWFTDGFEVQSLPRRRPV